MAYINGSRFFRQNQTWVLTLVTESQYASQPLGGRYNDRLHKLAREGFGLLTAFEVILRRSFERR